MLDRIAAGYIDFIRNTPLIVQLFFIAFGLPMLFGYVAILVSRFISPDYQFFWLFREILRSGLRRLKRDSLKQQRRWNLRNKTYSGRSLFLKHSSKCFRLSQSVHLLFLTTGVISEIGVEDLPTLACISTAGHSGP